MASHDTPAEVAALKHLSDVLTSGESKRDGYDAYNSGTLHNHNKVGHAGKQDLSSMSINDILESGSHGDAFTKDRVFAAGKYQIIHDTLAEAKRLMNLNGTQKFTPEMQEQIFSDYLIGPVKAPHAFKYIHKGVGTADDAVWDFAKIWRSIEVPNGYPLDKGLGTSTGVETFTKGDGNHTAKGSGAKVKAATEQARAAFAAGGNGGETATKAEGKPATATTTPETKPASKTAGAKTATPATGPTQPRDADGYRGYVLTGSVGKGGDNHHADVIAVQTRLHFFGIETKADGKMGPHTLHAIHAFQTPFHIHDGLIEVGKRSAKELFSGQVTVEAKIAGIGGGAKPAKQQHRDAPPKAEKLDGGHDDKTTANGAAQMARIAAIAASSSTKPPDHKCYHHVKEFIVEAGGYGNIHNIQTDHRFAGAIGEAHMFADRVDSIGPEKFGLEKLSASTPFEAPVGALVVVKHGSPGTAHPTAGDITVAGTGNKFFNGGVMHYGGPKAWPPPRGGLLGIYKPR